MREGTSATGANCAMPDCRESGLNSLRSRFFPPRFFRLSFFAGVNELPGSENGQFSDRRGREVPRVARNQWAF